MDNIWGTILGQVGGALLTAAVPVLVTVLAAVAALVGKWVVGMIKKSDSQLDDKIAAWCVAWAEDKFSLEKGGNGEEKLAEACEKIEELTKGRVKGEQAQVLIRAAYQGLYGELKQLKNG